MAERLTVLWEFVNIKRRRLLNKCTVVQLACLVLARVIAAVRTWEMYSN